MQFNIRADLATEKATAILEIDASAESVRELFITASAGQAMVYQQKQTEAAAFVANPVIAENQTPHLTAEAAALGTTRAAVATSIMSTAAQWRQVSAQIEARRISAKEAVRSAGSVFAVRDAKALDWSDIVALAG